jgi:hypothetical protein
MSFHHSYLKGGRRVALLPPFRSVALVVGVLLLLGLGLVSAPSATVLAADRMDDRELADAFGGSRIGLYEFTYRRMTADHLGWADMNPYALFDLGYTRHMTDDPGRVWPSLVDLMLTTGGSGEAVKTYFRPREGRAKPLSPHYMRGFMAAETTVTRLLQKGGFPTGVAGGHKDGLLDLSEAYGDMIWGELLHQLGMLSTRGLLAVRETGVRRFLPGGPGLDAGIMVRFGELPRLREPGGWGSYMDAMLETVRYEHPLFVEGLHTMTPAQINWLLALHNEALLKDHWILHGSYTFDENRSAALIDFGTTSALSEPNPKATLGYTSYEMEINESARVAAERMGDPGRDVPAEFREVKVRGRSLFNSVFLSTYAFQQMRRLGLTDAQILEHFTTETVPGSQFKLKFASDKALAFAEAILEVDKQTMHSFETFTVDSHDAKSAKINDRVLVNSRKLLRAILESRAFERPAGEGEIRKLLGESYFGTHGGAGGSEHIHQLLAGDPGKQTYLYQKVREIAEFCGQSLGQQLRSDHAGAVTRAKNYSVTQNLPSRQEVVAQAWKWANESGSFGREFKAWIEARLPQAGPEAERRKAHYGGESKTPLEPPREYFKALYSGCKNTGRL